MAPFGVNSITLLATVCENSWSWVVKITISDCSEIHNFSRLNSAEILSVSAAMRHNNKIQPRLLGFHQQKMLQFFELKLFSTNGCIVHKPTFLHDEHHYTFSILCIRWGDSGHGYCRNIGREFQLTVFKAIQSFFWLEKYYLPIGLSACLESMLTCDNLAIPTIWFCS